jgi:peptidase C25-like protein
MILPLLVACLLQDAPEYVIVAHDSLAASVQPLAEWKRQKGYRTRVVKGSEIGATPDEIRAFLKKTRPAYVLLVGNARQIPPASVKRQRRIDTDLYFGCLDEGDDWHPDVYVGRLPCGTPEQCAVMVGKILAYEKTPDSASCERALLAAEFADHDNDGYENEPFTEDGVAAKSYLERLGVRSATAFQRKPASTATPLRHTKTFTGEWDVRWAGGDVIKGTWNPILHPDGIPYVEAIELLPDNAAFLKRVNDTVNAGVGLVQFNLHGLTTKTVFPEYTGESIRSLSNGSKLPVVFVFACSTGTFTAENCFASEWLKNPKGGAVAVVASSGGSWGGYNDWLAHGMWNALHGDYFVHLAAKPGYTTIDYKGNRHGPTRRLGAVLAAGKAALFDLYRGETQREGMTRDTFETFNLLGDPEMELRLGKQEPLQVSARVGDGNVDVTVARAGRPCAGARVAPSRGEDVHAATAADGSARLSVPAGEWTLTVTARDSLPYQSKVQR